MVKNLVIIFLLLLFTVNVSAQLYNPLLGTVTIVSSQNVNGNNYKINIRDFNDLRGLKYAFNIQKGHYIWSKPILANKNCQVFKIDSIESLSNGFYNLYVHNLYESGFQGNAQIGDNLPIVESTKEFNLPAFIPSTGGDFGTIDATVQVCMLNDALNKIDSIKYKTLLEVDPIVDLDVIQDSIIILRKESGLTFGDTISIAGTVNYTSIDSDGLTILGDGTPSDRVRVDTNLIATQNYVQNQLKGFEVYTYVVGTNLTVNQNIINLPFTPSNLSNLFIERNGINQYINYSVSLTSNQLTFNDYNFVENEVIKIYYYN